MRGQTCACATRVGRAAVAQIDPVELCEAIQRGIVRQKNIDVGRAIGMPIVEIAQLAEFIGSIGGRSCDAVKESDGIAKPIGDWPEH